VTTLRVRAVCNLYSITTNQEAIIRLFRVMNRYVGNLPPMPGVFPDYPAPVVRKSGAEREMVMMRLGVPPPPKFGGAPVTNIRNTSSAHWRGWLKPENRCSVPITSFANANWHCARSGDDARASFGWQTSLFRIQISIARFQLQQSLR
jgi:putative SOS response-associated peptidase YedK